LCVRNGNAGKIDDIFNLVIALEDVDWLVHTDQHRADGLCAAKPLEQLVGSSWRSIGW